MAGRKGPPPAWANLSCTGAELCAVLAALEAGDDTALAADLAAGRHPVSAFTMLVERHRLACHLATRLRGTPLQAMLPEGLWDAIERRHQQQEQRTATFLAELRWLLPRFRDAGLDVMLLKGPELAARFHGGLHRRSYGDLDLLVRSRDRRAALQLLEAVGYTLRSRVLLSRSLMATVHHGFDFEGRGVRLDLHWCLSRQPGYRLDEEGFWARRVPWHHAGSGADFLVDVPHPADELHLLLISAFADLQRGALRLESLLDVRALQAALQPLDPDSFLAARRPERTAEVCRTMLRISDALLGSWCGDQRATQPGPEERQRILALLEPTPWPLRTKLWCARRLPVNLLHYGLWWLMSLPLRTAASHPLLRAAAKTRAPAV